MVCLHCLWSSAWCSNLPTIGLKPVNNKHYYIHYFMLWLIKISCLS